MERHLMSASQGMSAFYMYLLSNGDEDYMQQFNRYQISADASLNRMNKSDRGEFSNTWRTLKHNLKFERNNGTVYFPAAVRREYRDYFVGLYLHFNEISKGWGSSEVHAIVRIKVLTSMLAARALDLVSSDYGGVDMTAHHRLFDPVEVADTIGSDIQYLLAAKSSIIKPNAVRKLDSKFNFIKGNLVDAKSQTAFFMIYRNMLSMSKILKKY